LSQLPDRVDDPVDPHAQRLAHILNAQHLIEQLAQLGVVARGQRLKDGRLVRKELVERADRCAGALGDRVGRRRLVADLGENMSCRRLRSWRGSRRGSVFDRGDICNPP
jgi:hypothetical protein